MLDDFTLEYYKNDSGRLMLNIVAKKTVTLLDIRLEIPHSESSVLNFEKNKEDPELHYFCNGFQSWTTSEELTKNDRKKKLARILNPYGKHLGDYEHYYKYSGKKGILHSWSFSYIRQKEDYAFMGSLNEADGFTLFVHDANSAKTTISKDCKGLQMDKADSFKVFDLIFCRGNYYKVWQDYTSLLGQNPSKAEPATGWTSWYNYYDKIDEKIIIDNLNNFGEAKTPLDIFQIDDGYQKQMGDWLQCNEKFPGGMAKIADKIHEKGYKAGLWLAPFVASKKSEVFKNHPDWFLKDEKGKPLKVAINVIWKGPYYALDIYKPEVKAHLKNVIQTILYDWKYDLIKVDFLFGVCLKGRKDKTRGTIMSDAMKMLREYAGEKMILGCGVPLASAFNMVDYCRVGNDAHTGWEFGILKGLGNAERPSTWSTLTNTIMRFGLNGNVFLNDPDVFILRKENSTLTEDEKYTMLMINNLLGTVIFNSDNIDNYSREQMMQFKSIFPYVKPEISDIRITDQLYQIHFNVSDREYVFVANLQDKKTEFLLSSSDCFYAAEGKIIHSDDQQIQLKAHQSMLFYKIAGKQEIELLGSENHIISGAEVENMEIVDNNSINLSFKKSAQQSCPLLFFIKDKNIKKIRINGREHPVNEQLVWYRKAE